MLYILISIWPTFPQIKNILRYHSVDPGYLPGGKFVTYSLGGKRWIFGLVFNRLFVLKSFTEKLLFQI